MVIYGIGSQWKFVSCAPYYHPLPPHDAMMTIGSLSPIGHINYQNPIMERLGNQEERERETLASSSINNPMMDQAIKENLRSHKLSNSYDGPLDHDTHLAQCVLRTYTSRPNTIGSHS
jgi:hypothetical protein